MRCLFCTHQDSNCCLALHHGHQGLNRILHAWQQQDQVSSLAVDLLSRLLCPAGRRLTMGAVLQHPWLLEKESRSNLLAPLSHIAGSVVKRESKQISSAEAAVVTEENSQAQNKESQAITKETVVSPVAMEKRATRKSKRAWLKAKKEATHPQGNDYAICASNRKTRTPARDPSSPFLNPTTRAFSPEDTTPEKRLTYTKVVKQQHHQHTEKKNYASLISQKASLSSRMDRPQKRQRPGSPYR